MGRDNWQNDENLHQIIISHIKEQKIKYFLEDPARWYFLKIQNTFKDSKFFTKRIQKVSLKLIQILYLFFHWDYYSFLTTKFTLDSRLKNLKKKLKKISNKHQIIIISRSSGARISSLISDEYLISKLICISYPFKHPDYGDEPERYLHLKKINTPTLILQGEKDEYGGKEICNNYNLSKSIEVHFVNTNHSFQINKQQWDEVLNKIDKFIFD